MNNIPDSERRIYDAQIARKRYKAAQKRRKKRNAVIASIIAVIAVLAGICVFGILSTFSGSVTSYQRISDNLYSRSLEKSEIELSKKEKKLNEDWEKASAPVTKTLDKAYADYQNGEITYDNVINVLNAFSKLDNAKENCNSKTELVNQIKSGRDALEKAKDYIINSDMISALSMYLQVTENDTLNYNDAHAKAKEIEEQCSGDISYQINSFLAKYDIDGAKNYVNELSSKLGDSDFLTGELARINQYETYQNDLVAYNGEIEHVFTHCLIAYPELCYSSPEMTKSLDTDCITPTEFKGILQSVYEKGYILIDINMLIDESSGSPKIASLMLPLDKKPLILSIDDVTYDSRKMHTGMVDKLIVDEKGRICTYTKQSDGTEIVSYDNEVFPIVDEFVREHPDFSFRGARGTLCNTGFDGLFGYRSQNDPKEDVDSEKEREEALKIAQALKSEGWNFASHGYGHYHMSQIAASDAVEDTDKWQAEVASIVGPTKIMVWPYGDSVRSGSVHEYLYNTGFRLFCGVGSKPFITYEPDGLGIFMDRKPLDGYSLRNKHDAYLYLFDTYAVWDPLRPKEITW